MNFHITRKTHQLSAWLIFMLFALVAAGSEVRAQSNNPNFIRPGQEGRFSVIVRTPKQTKRSVLGQLGGREVVQFESTARVGSMGKMMTVDPKGFIWYVESREDMAVRIDPNTLEMTDFVLPRGAAPYSIASDNKGTLWITAHGIEMLLELHPDTAEVVSHQPPSHGFLIHINVDQMDNTVFFCQPGSNMIVSFHPDKGFKEFVIPTPNSGPGRMDFDSKHNVWFPELYTNKLAKLDPKTGKMEEWTLPTKESLPAYCRVDKQDNIWVSMPMVDKIGMFKDGNWKEYKIPTKESIVSSNIEDADGIVWFTEGGWRGSAGGNKIGRLDPKTGEVEELPLDTPNAQPLGMIIDRAGTIWFEQSSGGKISRIKLAQSADKATAKTVAGSK
jgi:virginiamycin B lyase